MSVYGRNEFSGAMFACLNDHVMFLQLMQRGIWCAAMDGELSKVKKLLSSGADPNQTDSSGYTPLVSSY